MGFMKKVKKEKEVKMPKKEKVAKVEKADRDLPGATAPAGSPGGA